MATKTDVVERRTLAVSPVEVRGSAANPTLEGYAVIFDALERKSCMNRTMAAFGEGFTRRIRT